MKTTNPFIISSYVAPEYFCNRKEETLQLKKSAVNSYNTALFSIRRMGKTGLINHLFYSLKSEEIKCIYFDIMNTRNINEFTYELGKAFFNQGFSKSKKMLNIAQKLLKSFSPSIVSDQITGNLSVELKFNNQEYVYDDLDGLFNFILKSDNKYCIAIDEFQQILNYPEKNVEATLRKYIQYINNASFIFSGSRKHLLLSIFEDSAKPLWQSCNFLELNPIQKNEYYSYVEEKFSIKGITIQEDAFSFIYNISQGITYYIQLLCNHLYNIDEKVINIKLVYDMLNILIKEREAYYINYLNLMSKKSRDLLVAIASENGVDKPLSKDFLMKYKLGAASTIKSVIGLLIKKEVIFKKDDFIYITDPLFSEWLKKLAI